MRDPMNWSVPLFRAFGIQVRLHLLYILITIFMVWHAIVEDPHHWWEFVLIWVVMLFVIILCHEFGHCFAARRVQGDADQILMWPLGGLAFCDVPRNPSAHWYTAAGGPVVNVIFCVITGSILLAFSYQPSFNVFKTRQLVAPELYSFKDDTTAVPEGFSYVTRADSPQTFDYGPRVLVEKTLVVIDIRELKAYRANEVFPPRIPDWIKWVARFFWMNWFLFLFNLVPAYPMDGGRLLQCIVWRRSDYATGIRWAVYSGFIVASIFVILSFTGLAPMLMGIAIFIFITGYRELYMLEMGGEADSMYGDFSQGYTSLEGDDPPPVKPKRVGPIKRWLQARRARKIQRENEQRAADEARLDELLEKINRQGKESLTEEEKRFMARVSARYRNRS